MGFDVRKSNSTKISTFTVSDEGHAQVSHRRPWWFLSIEKTTYLAALRWGYPIKVMPKSPIEHLGGFYPLKKTPSWQLCFGDTVNV